MHSSLVNVFQVFTLSFFKLFLEFYNAYQKHAAKEAVDVF